VETRRVKGRERLGDSVKRRRTRLGVEGEDELSVKEEKASDAELEKDGLNAGPVRAEDVEKRVQRKCSRRMQATVGRGDVRGRKIEKGNGRDGALGRLGDVKKRGGLETVDVRNQSRTSARAPEKRLRPSRKDPPNWLTWVRKRESWCAPEPAKRVGLTCREGRAGGQSP